MTPGNQMPTPIIRATELASLGTKNVRILDARSGPVGREAYGKSHLRGAIHADLDRDLAGPATRPDQGGRHPLPAIDVWARTLGRWGITPSTRVVVYDAAGGANAAARAWWMLRAVGHAEVAVLDGGFDAAVEAGFAVDDAPPSVAPVTPYPVSAWRLPTVDIHDVERVRNDPSKRVVDVRAAERFRGEVETFDPIAGHIPGAINVPYAENLDPHGMFRAPLELAEHYRAVFGDVGAEHVVVHCGSGVTACHTLLALDLAGIRGAALYVGSWSEWCRTDRPKAPSRP